MRVFRPAYVRRHNVSVSLGSGRYTLHGTNAAARSDCHQYGVPSGSVSAREVSISPLSNGDQYPEWLVGIDKKPVSSGGCCRLPGQASGGLGGEAESEDS